MKRKMIVAVVLIAALLSVPATINSCPFSSPLPGWIYIRNEPHADPDCEPKKCLLEVYYSAAHSNFYYVPRGCNA